MNTQHTPGPWAVDLDRDFTLGGDYCQVEALTPDGMVSRDICECPLDTDDHPDGPEWSEGAANARLIAAAPDLLEVVERFATSGWLAGVAPEVDSNDPVAALLARAHAALGKVRGLSGQNVIRVRLARK